MTKNILLLKIALFVAAWLSIFLLWPTGGSSINIVQPVAYAAPPAAPLGQYVPYPDGCTMFATADEYPYNVVEYGRVISHSAGVTSSADNGWEMASTGDWIDFEIYPTGPGGEWHTYRFEGAMQLPVAPENGDIRGYVYGTFNGNWFIPIFPWPQAVGVWRSAVLTHSQYFVDDPVPVTTTLHILNQAGVRWIRDLKIADAECTPVPPEPDPVQFDQCELVTDADFTDETYWDLFNGATITNSVLSLAGVDYAEQIISGTVEAGRDYTVVLTATGTTTETDILAIELVGTGGLITETLTLTDTTTAYSLTISTGPTISEPRLRLLMYAGSGDIDYICLSLNLFTAVHGECLTDVIDGGEFTTAVDAAYWLFVNGATHNEAGGNAWLPHIISGTIDNGYTSAVGRPTLTGTPPELEEDEYLILEFDVKSLGGDGAIIARYRNDSITDSVIITYTFDTASDYYTYQTDFGFLAGDVSNIEVGFYNASYVVTETTGLFLDNICLFVSNQPPADPMLSDGYLVGFNLPTCVNLTSWLSATLNVDLASLETMESPSVWDPEDWVPWLASRLWVYAIKPLICFLLILFNILGLSFLNWLAWVVRQPDIVFAWAGGWIAYFLYDLGRWLLWFSSPLIRALAFLYAITTSWQATLAWLGSVVSWLLDLATAIVFWLIGYWIAEFLTVINVLIAAWNLLLPSVSSVASEIVDLAVTIWNDWLVPWLENFGAIGQFLIFLISHIGLLGYLIVLFFNTIWHFVIMIWGFLTGAADLPLTFYQAFNNSINGPAFELLNCNGDVSNYWCLGLAGLVIVDESIAHSFLYPMVIIGIILATILIFWRYIWDLISFRIR